MMRFQMSKYGRHHIGTKFNDGNPIVVNGGDKNGYVKVKCLVCAKDPELFGDAIFERSHYSLSKGFLTCGCSNKPVWTLQQYEIRIKRKIMEECLPIKFIGFGKNSGRPSSSQVRLFCNRMGVEFTINSINSFFKGDGNLGIPHSASEVISKYNTDNPNSIVWDSGIRIGSAVWCGFYCKICESNGFESLFESNLNNLGKGKIPCYCSSKKSLSGDHITEMAKRRLYEQNAREISVIGAVKKGAYWFPTFVCKVHGLYSRVHDSVSSVGYQCIECNPPKTGYDKTKRGYIYILDIQTTAGLVVGYGITNKINKRLSTHRFKLSRIGATITNIQVFEGSGTAVLAVENAIKSLHTTGLLDCEGFRRESISIDMKDKVLEKCKKLKELDNPNKLI